MQKPISVDVLEGRAMLEAARKHGRVVQVGLQRRSTPHSGRGKRPLYSRRKARQDRAGRDLLLLPHARDRESAGYRSPRRISITKCGPGPRRCGLTTHWCIRARWRAFMEYGNGIVGDMCVHMLDMTRWMLDLGWPTRISSTGGILVDKSSKANISDTQTATLDFGDLRVVWQHRSWGEADDPKYPWGATFYGDKATLKASVYGYDFIPLKARQAVHRDVTYELEQYPEDKTEKDIEKHVAPAVRYHMKNFLQAIDARSKPVSTIEEGYISTASCILANNAMKLGRTLHWDSLNSKS